jgi:hypothetical protein
VPFILGGPQYKGDGGIFQDYYQFGKWDNGSYDKIAKIDSEGELFTGLYGYGVNVNVSGSSEYAGFGIGFNSGGVSGGSFWVQPLGSAALRFGFSGGNMSITSNGLVEGLSVGLTLPKLLDGAFDKDLNADNTFVNAWRQLKVSVGYTIADIGTISVGYNGGWAEKIDHNNLTDFQYVYLYNRAPPTTPVRINPTGWGGTGGTAVSTDPLVTGSINWEDWEDPDWEKMGKTVAKNPILAVEELAYGDANFTAGFSLSALSSMGLGINLNASLYLPQEAKFAYTTATEANNFTVERKNTGYANLSLGVNYNSGDFGIGFSFSADQLGRKRTITYTGLGIGSVNISKDNDADETGDKMKPKTRAIGITETQEPVKMKIGLTPRYTIDGTTIGVNLNASFTSESREIKSGHAVVTPDVDPNTDKLKRDSEAQYSFGAFVRFKSFGKATLQVGIDVATPVLLTAPGAKNLPGPLANTQPIPKDEKSRFFISVPISFSVSF